ncbi:hypothetical protein M2451_002688 [Dysgonomonas sp. PFB1-18]|uniref:DUF3408 domain-containing protein n=1 Tax=unclassified Dysgonomonas TaxID=2630389 RepID=UPI002475A2FB|nr:MULTISPECIES: DUF3408 domain-containing protein [unclassified Dysgonomonas]MDH6309426.1 hypothetical protein [Dysgonomonas sp. PF1-14]MDH6339709.1 hypothetical protein [Dysgonomonas sp. PF1-16]MDH6381357.1 hypothetical protein [Dysgonomonas sp. PFB1-18]MDH6398572.1 hypothetical protein [Dysgonomonas sp. PF1-23]
MDKEKNKSKSEGQGISIDAGSKEEAKINPNAFIRNIAVAGNTTSLPAHLPISMQDTEQEDENSNESETKVDTSEPKTKESIKRRKGQTATIDYETVFLARNELSNRQGLYIDKENYEVLQTLVRSIRFERLSVSGLVDNIVKHHIELYGDEINRIFEENIRKPIK